MIAELSLELIDAPHKQDTPESAFLHDCLRVKIAKLLPLKVLRSEIKTSMKYQQILASVRAVGLVEPPVISPVPKKSGSYFLLDGHLRIEALRDLGQDSVDCLVAKDDDTFSYNKRVNRLSAVQDHKMIVRAMQRGASAERLGVALGLSPQTIRAHFRLLKGICDEAVELLADTPCAAKVFDILRMMKPLRQIEVAELMVGNKNFSVMFANALLANTTPNQLVADSRAAAAEPVSAESVARIERELASLQMQIKDVEETYGPDVLHLTVVKGYLAKLLANPKIIHWLAKHQPDYLREFQKIAEMSELKA